MYAFDVLGGPVRRRILELLADGEQTSGAVTDVIRIEFGISQPAVRCVAGPVPPVWEQRLDALGTELARGRRARRTRASGALAQPAGLRTDPGRTDPPTERT